ncbi:hypothetical protein GCM10023210_09990 [Chryseobacterium ginsengisoli]|uniref:Exo-alpha-sialidase n=1 Tax=Chryseobacterium ginsengisoli TaxID=363853 RepID=A0ABP9LZY3_9FLAO
MKNIILMAGALVLTSANVEAQIGVNTATPKSTMDISAKRDSGGNITDNTQIFGLMAPRITRAELTSNTATYAADQRGALIYITDVSGGDTSGQRANINAIGYYFFNGSTWQKVVSDNIYTANGSLTGYRTLNLNGNTLNFQGTEQKTSWGSTGGMAIGNSQTGTGEASLAFYGGGNSNFFIQQFYNGYTQMLTSGNSNSLLIGTHATTSSAPINFSTSSGGGALGTIKMVITGQGNVGINATSPTEKLDVNGNTRLRNLPLSGTGNAIYTQSGGNASTVQDQTFTGTRTVVADANGVLGYINGIPSDPGTPRILVSASVPRTQDIKNTTSTITGDFSAENLDPLNAWSSNVFTVPAGMSSIYVIAMQVSNKHVAESGTWYTVAYFQRSTDGGATWNPILADTRSNMLGSDLDNGNSLNWTGSLNAGDKIRVRFNCSATNNNIVDLGSVTVTKLAQ